MKDLKKIEKHIKKMKEIRDLMNEYNLTIEDIPAFLSPETDLKKVIMAIGKSK